MQLSFRQGLVQYKPGSVYKTGNNFALEITTKPLIVTFAQGQTNYLFIENRDLNPTWVGPFNTTDDYWLYWDINTLTATRTFGQTIYDPITSYAAPTNPLDDQHWFDLSTSQMKVWNGGAWAIKIRTFLGTLKAGTILSIAPLGTQVGDNTPNAAGTILYDDSQKPVIRYDLYGQGEFLTSESYLATQTNQISSLKLEATPAAASVAASSAIPAYSLVTRGPTSNTVLLASNTSPLASAIGMSPQSKQVDEVVTFFNAGYFTNLNWSWPIPGAALFLGITGIITTSVPSAGIVQRIGTVINSNTILLNIQPHIRLQP